MRKILLIVTLLTATLLFAVLLPRQSVQADTFTVTNTNDSGTGSLRQAITDANSRTGADIITFATATNGIPIILSGPAGEDDNVSGDLDIFNGGDLTIQGNGPANTIIDGGGVDRVFHICPGGCTQNVTISGVTIQNGLVATGGGGIRNAADTLIVDDSVIRKNISTLNGGGITNLATLIIQNGSIIGGAGAGNQTYTGNGGGIYNHSGSMTVDDSIISGNLAGYNGGAVWSQATLLIQNGSIIGGAGAGNTASNNGGGIFNYGTGTVNIDGSTVSNNSATIDGGGIHNNATLNVQNSSIIGGIGEGNDAERGGGIYNESGGTTTVDGSTVSANSATIEGGGIYNYSTLSVQNGSIIGGLGAGNSSNNKGGGIYNMYDSTTTVDDSAVSANLATTEGGGIYNCSMLSVQNGSVIGGSGAGNSTNKGGGIYNTYGGTTTVDNSTVSANSANYGGGIYTLDILTIQNGSTIGGAGAGNTAVNNGGGIDNSEGKTTVDTSTVSANSADYGGGIVNSDGRLIVNNSTVSVNMAASDGGGIYNQNYGVLTVDGSTISDNSANYGGGVYSWRASNATVTGSRILNNAATTNGGGVYSDVDIPEITIVSGSCIVGNSAMSFFNNQPEGQTAINNWWGVATGPNTPGADTVLGNVDVSGFLTTPILDCAPDLQASKANDTDGDAFVGTPFHWSVIVANTGLIDATFQVGQTILVDELPEGPTYGAPVVGNVVDVTNSTNIDCTLAGNTLTCEAKGGSVTLGAVSGQFEVTFPATPTATVTLVNPAGKCMVDPDENVTEGDENNNCPTNVVSVAIKTISIYLPLIPR